eukprot:747175-Hanusia_phi.AAC.7
MEGNHLCFSANVKERKNDIATFKRLQARPNRMHRRDALAQQPLIHHGRLARLRVSGHENPHPLLG